MRPASAPGYRRNRDDDARGTQACRTRSSCSSSLSARFARALSGCFQSSARLRRAPPRQPAVAYRPLPYAVSREQTRMSNIEAHCEVTATHRTGRSACIRAATASWPACARNRRSVRPGSLPTILLVTVCEARFPGSGSTGSARAAVLRLPVVSRRRWRLALAVLGCWGDGPMTPTQGQHKSGCPSWLTRR